MKQSIILLTVFCLCGCEGFWLAATEAQKENAWLHTQVCSAAADAAVEENASQELCELTALSQEQSTAFVADYGLPERSRDFPLAVREFKRSRERQRPVGACSEAGSFGHTGGEVREVLSQAKSDSMRKPDVFELADGVMELGIAIAGLVGGVYGIRIAGHLKQAREKSRALKEIVEGNELFKQLWPEQAERFKEAQQKQSAATKQIVTQLKAG